MRTSGPYAHLFTLPGHASRAVLFDPNDEGTDISKLITDLDIPQKVVEALAKEASGKGDDGWKAVAMQLVDQNRTMRRKLKEATDAPKDAVVITDKDERDARSVLIEKFGSIKDALPKIQALETAQAEAQKQQTLAEFTRVMDDAGLQGSMLARLVDPTKVKPTKVSVKGADGTEVSAFHVEVTGADGKVVQQPLDAWLDATLPDFKDVLKKPDASGQEGQQQGGTQQQANGTFVVATPNGSGNGNGGGDESAASKALQMVLGQTNQANATKLEGGK